MKEKRKLTKGEKIALVILAVLIVAVACTGAWLIIDNVNNANKAQITSSSSAEGDEELTSRAAGEDNTVAATDADSTAAATDSSKSKTSSKTSNSAEPAEDETTASKTESGTNSKTSSSTKSNSDKKKSKTKTVNKATDYSDGKVPVVEPETNETHASEKVLKVNGKKVYVGDTITVTVDMTTPVVLVNYQGFTQYDSNVLKFVSAKSNSGGLTNNKDSAIYYNSSILSGIDFTSGGTIYTAEFEVIGEGSTNINNTLAGARQGGVLGTAQNGTTTVENCTYSGTLDGNDAGGGGNYGGIIGYINNNAAAIAIINNCLFDGEVVNNNETPGSCTFGGIIGYNNSGTVTIKNCLSIGTVRSARYSQFFGAINGNNSTFENNYYVGDNVNGSGSGGTVAGPVPVKVTKYELANGEICFKLNAGQTETNWYQTINEDDYPVLNTGHETVLFNEAEGYFYNLVDGVPVGVKDVERSLTTDQSIYNLAGQRLSKLQKGINIVNSKKVLVK